MNKAQARVIAYITGSRAEFGLVSPLLSAVSQNSNMKLNLYATGIHLSKIYGNTIDLVKKEFPNVTIINALYGSDRLTTTLFASTLIKGIVDEFDKRPPDVVLVHGDRIEMLATALASLYLGIPIAHIHGGDKTKTVDDSARHAITKLSHLHFPATKLGAELIAKMGEERSRIYIVGALGLDALKRITPIPRNKLLRKLNLPSECQFILILQHPVSEEIRAAGRQMRTTLKAVLRSNLPIVIIFPNGDPGSNEIIAAINAEKSNPLIRIFLNLDYNTFASTQKEASVWVGNSSAGIVESTFFKTPVVNIGTRQEGRARSPNIIDVPYNQKSIYAAIQKSLYDANYRRRLRSFKNPWGNGEATEKIMKVLETVKLGRNLLIKK